VETPDPPAVGEVALCSSLEPHLRFPHFEPKATAPRTSHLLQQSSFPLMLYGLDKTLITFRGLSVLFVFIWSIVCPVHGSDMILTRPQGTRPRPWPRPWLVQGQGQGLGFGWEGQSLTFLVRVISGRICFSRLGDSEPSRHLT